MHASRHILFPCTSDCIQHYFDGDL